MTIRNSTFIIIILTLLFIAGNSFASCDSKSGKPNSNKCEKKPTMMDRIYKKSKKKSANKAERGIGRKVDKTVDRIFGRIF